LFLPIQNKLVVDYIALNKYKFYEVAENNVYCNLTSAGEDIWQGKKKQKLSIF
jgi:hypothetical protein